MLGQRRLPPQVLFLLSLLLGLLAATAAYRSASAENWLPAALWGGLAVWLVVDAVRALGWMKHGRNLPAQTSAQPPAPAPQPSTPPALSVDPAVTGAQTNPLLRDPQAGRSVQSTDQLD
ncbi:hypothetical protein [Deinococcus piscis]|nr:hypothetical protein [Deinococcus piscis]